ncbi:MAG: DUF6951 family protein [Mahellales bacterium]|jgi:hypothetical protein
MKVKVDSGVCRFITNITASCEDMQNVTLDIESQCPHIQKMGEQLKQVDAYKEIFSKLNNSIVYTIAAHNIAHVACPVPSAILKAIEAAAGLALSRDVYISMSEDE